MVQVQTEVTCQVAPSFRVQQVAGMFDVPLVERCREVFAADIPTADEAWRIGLIVGPSGSGKTTLARAVFGAAIARQAEWSPTQAVVDGFPAGSIKTITSLLTAVGLSSPPSWVKPYAVLSNGEKFRCDLARALLQAGDGLLVFDEFTSVVDRTVAKAGSAAVARAIRRDLVPARFVAVTCHYDVAEWLEPDWLVDMSTGQCQRRSLRRPRLEIEIARCHRNHWTLFKRHHYLSGSLCPTARCYLASWQGEPVAFCATLPILGRRQHWRITRLVTLPDYQGLGIGLRVAEAVGDLHREQGFRFNITTSHPAVIAACGRSSRWQVVGVKPTGRKGNSLVSNCRGSLGRAVVSFEYLPKEQHG